MSPEEPPGSGPDAPEENVPGARPRREGRVNPGHGARDSVKPGSHSQAGEKGDPGGLDPDQLDPFERIGYARALGGFFYEFFFAILGAALLAVSYGFILAVLYPYPEGQAYNLTVEKVFSIVFLLFDVPTKFALARFIGDYRIKNPHKMVEYIRFYVWYQMLTGLVLVTMTSVWIFQAIRYSDFSYLAWVLLVYITREYPAMLSVFTNALRGLQAFDKEAWLNFIKDTLLAKGFEVVCVLLGRWWGAQHPAIGDLMGLAIGFAIGTYVDDFFAMWVSAHYLRQVLEPMGYEIKDLLVPRFSRDVVKSSLLFGFQTAIPELFQTILGFVTFFWWYEAVPAYATFLVLSRLADDIANITKAGGGINTTAAISEAYLNGKEDLTRFYIAQTWKWYGFFTFGVGMVIVAFLPIIIEVLLVAGGAENYLLAVPFLLPNVIHTLIEQPEEMANNIILGANRPHFYAFGKVFLMVGGIFFTWFWLAAVRLPQQFGIAAIVWLLPMSTFVSDLAIVLIDWYYIHTRVLRVKIPLWQTFAAPLIPGLVLLGAGLLYRYTAYVWLLEAVGVLATAVISVLLAFVGGFMFLYLSLYGYFGGWDDYGLEVFRRAVYMSGPSKVFFVPIYKITAWLVRKSPFHNRFPIPWRAADREAVDLMEERARKDAASK